MTDTTKKCPMCAEEIPLTAATCEYCGAQFEVTSSGYCQNCHQVRETDGGGQCKVCGNPLDDIHVRSRLIEQLIQFPAPLPQPAKKKIGWILLPIGALVILLICTGVLALLWSRRNNLLVVPQPSATFAPTNTQIPIPTIGPTETQKPTPRPQPTATKKPSFALLAPSEVKVTSQCSNLGPSTRPGANRYELTVFITWKDNATNELGYIIYQYGTEIGRVDANVTRFAVSRQSRFAIYLSEEFGVLAWNNQGKSEKMNVIATFSCP